MRHSSLQQVRDPRSPRKQIHRNRVIARTVPVHPSVKPTLVSTARRERKQCNVRSGFRRICSVATLSRIVPTDSRGAIRWGNLIRSISLAVACIRPEGGLLAKPQVETEPDTAAGLLSTHTDFSRWRQWKWLGFYEI